MTQRTLNESFVPGGKRPIALIWPCLMQIEQRPARAGWQWIKDGFALLRSYPIPLLTLTFLYLLMLTVPSMLPGIGGFLPLLLTPLLAVGLMTAMLSAEQGRLPLPRLLFQGLRVDGAQAWKPLLILGGLNLVTTLGALMLASLVDDGTLMRLITGQVERDDPGLAEIDLMIAAAVFLILYTPIQMALWFAPLFVAWHRIAPVKAMFFSLVAVWRNRGAFLIYALGWLAIAVALSMAIQILSRTLDPGPLILSFVLSPLSLAMLAALYASSWISYRDTVRDEFRDIATLDERTNKKNPP